MKTSGDHTHAVVARPMPPSPTGRTRGMAKQVIFVEGAAYSGSTMLLLMLANDPNGFACGEVHLLFRPLEPRHVHRRCTCGEPDCSTWPPIVRAGKDRLYRTIFELHPELDFVVDSSKRVFWSLRQQRNLRAQGIRFHNLLIWKTPLELAASMKRRRQPNWRRAWLDTHRLYLTCMPGLRTIRYEDLVRDSHALEAACETVGIPYFQGKEAYWQRPQCLVAGSSTATYHMFDEERAAILRAKSARMNGGIPYRTIAYRPVMDPALIEDVERAMTDDPLFARLTGLLEQADVANQGYDPAHVEAGVRAVSMPRARIELRRAKYHLRTLVGFVRYRNAPRFAEAEPEPTAGSASPPG